MAKWVMEQHHDEITRFLVWLQRRFPANTGVLEIGVRHGGTSQLWSTNLPQRKVVGVDRIGHDSYQEPEFSQRAAEMESEFPHYWFIAGDSHSKVTFDTVKNVLQPYGVGFLFIDGDHSYEGVQRDFELYSPLVMPGGVIAFHDIVDGPRTGGGVTRFFRELVELGGWKETRQFITEQAAADWGGIGAVVLK